MRFCFIFAVAVCVFVCGGECHAAVTETGHDVHPDAINDSRQVQVDQTNDTEERSIIQTITDEATKMANMAFWVKTAQSDEFVKKALGLDNLAGKALKANANYKIFKVFQSKMDEPKIVEWLNKDTTTAEVWTTLGLNKLTVEELKNSRELKTYIRYAKRLDDDIWNHKRASFEPDFPSAAELSVKVHLWAKAGRPQWYVFEMLGKSAIKGNTNYEYYQLFLKLLRKQAKKNK